MGILLIGLIVVCMVVDHSSGMVLSGQNYCHSEDESPYLYMGSKTSYDTIRGINAIPLNRKYCKPVKFWSLNRHGTRVAGADQLQGFKLLVVLRDEIIKNHEEDERGSLCKTDLKVLRSWKWDETLENLENTLTDEGFRELETIARRYKKRIAELLHRPYNETKFVFRYTNEERTQASCQAFISGMFGSDKEVQTEEPIENDPILRLYKNCSSWQNDSKEKSEQKAFLLSSVFKKLTMEVSQRLGFHDNLNVEIVVSMYDMCRFYKAWNPREISPWCVAFTREHLLILEYVDDLKHLYKSGYGRPINRLIGCPTVNDMVEMFTSHVEGSLEVPDVVAYFSHDTMMLLTLTALGVAEDEELPTAENYERMFDRQWRTTLISAFATNLVSVLYKCNFDEEQYWVQMYLNEKPLNICQSNGENEDSQGWCSWSDFQKRFSPFRQCNTDVCNDERIVKNNENNQQKQNNKFE